VPTDAGKQTGVVSGAPTVVYTGLSPVRLSSEYAAVVVVYNEVACEQETVVYRDWRLRAPGRTQHSSSLHQLS
jgi:hypothetical protein